MADNRPPGPSYDSSLGDPFADRPRQTHFTEPQRPYQSASLAPSFESTTSLPNEFGANSAYDDDEYIEKVPLTSGENFTGGFYPPG